MSSVTLRQRFALHLRGEVPCIAVAMLVDPRTYELTGIDAEISGTMTMSYKAACDKVMHRTTHTAELDRSCRELTLATDSDTPDFLGLAFVQAAIRTSGVVDVGDGAIEGSAPPIPPHLMQLVAPSENTAEAKRATLISEETKLFHSLVSSIKATVTSSHASKPRAELQSAINIALEVRNPDFVSAATVLVAHAGYRSA